MRLVWMMAAGAIGVLCRYEFTLGIQVWLNGRGARLAALVSLGPTFPLATMVINVLGSFLLAFLTTLALQSVVRPDLRVILGTGFLGAFTTFSTFELESESLIARAQWWPAGCYIGGNLVLGFLAILAGRMLALRMFGPSAGF